MVEQNQASGLRGKRKVARRARGGETSADRRF